jgi:hypothetical protein
MGDKINHKKNPSRESGYGRLTNFQFQLECYGTDSKYVYNLAPYTAEYGHRAYSNRTTVDKGFEGFD